jgi:hypothetical protein
MIHLKRCNQFADSGIVEIIPYTLSEYEQRHLDGLQCAYIIGTENDGVDLLIVREDGIMTRRGLVKNPVMSTTRFVNHGQNTASISYNDENNLLMTAFGVPDYSECHAASMMKTNNLAWAIDEIDTRRIVENEICSISHTNPICKFWTPVKREKCKCEGRVFDLMDTLHPGSLLANPYQDDGVLAVVTSYSGDVKLIDGVSGKLLANGNQKTCRNPNSISTITSCYTYPNKVDIKQFVVAQTVHKFKLYDILWNDNCNGFENMQNDESSGGFVSRYVHKWYQ